MWTIVGIISFFTYALVRLADRPTKYWRVRIFSVDDRYLEERISFQGWAVIVGLCLIMVVHLIQVWMLYLKSKRARGNRQPSINEEELQAFNNN